LPKLTYLKTVKGMASKITGLRDSGDSQFTYSSK